MIITPGQRIQGLGDMEDRQNRFGFISSYANDGEITALRAASRGKYSGERSVERSGTRRSTRGAMACVTPCSTGRSAHPRRARAASRRRPALMM
ncbi:hypothetical protein [Sorangium sp. So ce1099]|uniref:hypothetical protein n=1 Tax=Sorangium sp. So ce1099 TaxID=3133331 RepID=UPI003F62C217